MTKLLDTGEPYYLQIAGRLRDMVLDLPSGERLPSEPALAKSFKVSRFTVAKAVEQLVNDGLIYRKQGSGHLCGRGAAAASARLSSLFTEAVQAAGHLATHKVLESAQRNGLPACPTPGTRLLSFSTACAWSTGLPSPPRSILSAQLLDRIELTEAVVRRPDFSLYSHFAEKRPPGRLRQRTPDCPPCRRRGEQASRAVTKCGRRCRQPPDFCGGRHATRRGRCDL